MNAALTRWLRISRLAATRPAALPAALEIRDEILVTHSLLSHPGIEPPTCLTQRLALLELGGAVHRNVEPDRAAVLGDRDGLGGLEVIPKLLAKLTNSDLGGFCGQILQSTPSGGPRESASWTIN